MKLAKTIEDRVRSHVYAHHIAARHMHGVHTYLHLGNTNLM